MTARPRAHEARPRARCAGPGAAPAAISRTGRHRRARAQATRDRSASRRNRHARRASEARPRTPRPPALRRSIEIAPTETPRAHVVAAAPERAPESEPAPIPVHSRITSRCCDAGAERAPVATRRDQPRTRGRADRSRDVRPARWPRRRRARRDRALPPRDRRLRSAHRRRRGDRHPGELHAPPRRLRPSSAAFDSPPGRSSAQRSRLTTACHPEGFPCAWFFAPSSSRRARAPTSSSAISRK